MRGSGIDARILQRFSFLLPGHGALGLGPSVLWRLHGEPLVWDPLSSGVCMQNVVCAGFTEEEDIQGSFKSSKGSLAEDLIFSLFA